MVHDCNGIDQALEQDGRLGCAIILGSHFTMLSHRSKTVSALPNEGPYNFRPALMVGCNQNFVEILCVLLGPLD